MSRIDVENGIKDGIRRSKDYRSLHGKEILFTEAGGPYIRDTEIRTKANMGGTQKSVSQRKMLPMKISFGFEYFKTPNALWYLEFPSTEKGIRFCEFSALIM